MSRPSSAAAARVPALSLAQPVAVAAPDPRLATRDSRPAGLVVRVLSSPAGRIGLVLLVLLVAMASLAPLIAPHDPLEQHPGLELRGPSGSYWLGTDELGRDLLSRIMYGARTALSVAVIAVGVASLVGVAAGLVAGYFGGMADAVLMRVCDVILTFPGILVGVVVVTVLGPGPINVAWALALGLIPTKARLIRSSVLSERERDHVLAARASGATDVRIMLQHILPNALSPLIINIALSLGFTVLGEASLSFLGLGTQPPDASWGSMLNTARGYLRVAPWYGVLPGAALVLLVYALNSLADALRDALDPHLTRL